MATADFNHNDFTTQGTAEADKALAVRFYIEAREDKAASLAEGRPIYTDREIIEIKIPGNRGGGACRVATRRDLDRFPDHYRMFKARIESGAEEKQSGTPLEEYPGVGRSQVEELKFFNVHTVEALASMTDANALAVRGWKTLKDNAAIWLELAGNSVAAKALKDENEAKDQRIKDLEDKLERLLSGDIVAKTKSRKKKVADPEPETEED